MTHDPKLPSAVRYFEDQSPDEQASQRARRKAEIEAIGRMKFPVRADFAGQSVKILGPVARFSPYKEQGQGPEDPFQLMVRSTKGNRFITLASGLRVNGKLLVTPVLPLRERPNPFDRSGLGEKPANLSSSAKKCSVTTVRVAKAGGMKIAI